MNRIDITEAIISKERDLSDVELVFRALKIEEINSSYGFAYISNIIDENNSRSYFTTRLVASMKNSGYDIIQAIPDEYEIWLKKKNSKVKIQSKVVNESPNVDEFLKTHHPCEVFRHQDQAAQSKPSVDLASLASEQRLFVQTYSHGQ